jgi:hypothetical protein
LIRPRLLANSFEANSLKYSKRGLTLLVRRTDAPYRPASAADGSKVNRSRAFPKDIWRVRKRVLNRATAGEAAGPGVAVPTVLIRQAGFSHATHPRCGRGAVLCRCEQLAGVRRERHGDHLKFARPLPTLFETCELGRSLCFGSDRDVSFDTRMLVWSVPWTEPTKS